MKRAVRRGRAPGGPAARHIATRVPDDGLENSPVSRVSGGFSLSDAPPPNRKVATLAGPIRRHSLARCGAAPFRALRGSECRRIIDCVSVESIPFCDFCAPLRPCLSSSLARRPGRQTRCSSACPFAHRTLARCGAAPFRALRGSECRRIIDCVSVESIPFCDFCAPLRPCLSSSLARRPGRWKSSNSARSGGVRCHSAAMYSNWECVSGRRSATHPARR